jgi:uncharacterized metal-binding protein YceD (DUF177 family)
MSNPSPTPAKIERRDLEATAKGSKTFHLRGDEPWLDRLYADFPPPAGGEAPRLTGPLTLTAEEGGSVHVRGHLAYVPFVACSRCAVPIPWPLDLEVDARFYPEDVNPAPREKNLSAADLDAYSLQDGAVDLEEVVNDAVQTGLPSQILLTTEDGDSCRVCKADLTDDRVFGTDEKEGASPFAALKGLKLPN